MHLVDGNRVDMEVSRGRSLLYLDAPSTGGLLLTAWWSWGRFDTTLLIKIYTIAVAKGMAKIEIYSVFTRATGATYLRLPPMK